MKTAIKKIVSRTYKPFLEKYLSKKRIYTHGGIRLEIPPEVFHPGFFTSTQFLFQYIRKLELKNKNFLELGAGNGLISIYATKHKAKVTATDINPVAIEYLQGNSQANKVQLSIIHSDLFDKIQKQLFDVIAINPPYYKNDPQTLLDYAWYCGENGEFFCRLFAQLSDFVNQNSDVTMVLCDGCDIEMIEREAIRNKFMMKCVETKQTLIEKNFIYKIEKAE